MVLDCCNGVTFVDESLQDSDQAFDVAEVRLPLENFKSLCEEI